MIYRRVSRGLFFVAASFAGFLIPWSEDILRIALGPAYAGGATALGIMFLYPLHQSMGQIAGTMMYATGRVRAQVVIGMLTMALGIVATYFVLAPPDAPVPGFGLGSGGLAGKMVIMQILAVNGISIYLARSMQVKFDWTYQPIGLVACLGLGWIAYVMSRWLFEAPDQVALGMLASGFIYSILIITVIWATPSLVGLSRGELRGLARRVRYGHRVVS